MLNNVCLIGRLTAEPRYNETAKDPVSSFQLAVDRDFGKETDFFSVVSWGKTAEFAYKYLHKGMLIGVNGRLVTRSYTDRNEQKRTVTEIVASNLYFCEKRNSSTSTFEDLGDGDGGELPF